MEKFKKFEIKGQALIFGGEIRETCWYDDYGNGGCDEYNTESNTIAYVECVT